MTDLKEISHGRWVATVECSEYYNVEIVLNGEVIESWECDCPYDMGDICKHVVAVLMEIRGKMKKISLNIEPSESTTIMAENVNVSFDDIMKLAKDEDLRLFVECYDMNDNTFKLSFVDYITQRYIKPKGKIQKDYVKEMALLSPIRTNIPELQLCGWK